MRTLVSIMLAALALLGPAVPAPAGDVVVPAVDTPWPGKIFVGFDEWPLSDSAFLMTPNDSAALARALCSRALASSNSPKASRRPVN